MILDVVYNHSADTSVFSGITNQYYTSSDLSGVGNSLNDGVPMVAKFIENTSDIELTNTVRGGRHRAGTRGQTHGHGSPPTGLENKPMIGQHGRPAPFDAARRALSEGLRPPQVVNLITTGYATVNLCWATDDDVVPHLR